MCRCTQRLVINDSVSNCKDLLSVVSQKSVLGSALFNIFINELDVGIDSRLIQSAHDKRMGQVASTWVKKIRFQNDFDILEECSDINRMTFNKDKYNT